MRVWFVPLILLLAACASPRARCEADATRDIRVLDGLIAETEATINRGYALRTVQVPYTYVSGCLGGGSYWGHVGWCERTAIRTKQVPEAIEIDEERAKLASMRADRDRRARAVGDALIQCQRRYPE